MSNKTTYTYGAGINRQPAAGQRPAHHHQPQRPARRPRRRRRHRQRLRRLGRVTAQTDPMGYKTTFNYCVNAAAGDCMNAATGTGFVTVTDPDGNTTVYDYDPRHPGRPDVMTTGDHPDLRARQRPPTSAADGTSGGTLLDTTSTDGDGNTTTYTYNASGQTSIRRPPRRPHGTDGHHDHRVTTATCTS